MADDFAFDVGAALRAARWAVARPPILVEGAACDADVGAAIAAVRASQPYVSRVAAMNAARRASGRRRVPKFVRDTIGRRNGKAHRRAEVIDVDATRRTKHGESGRHKVLLPVTVLEHCFGKRRHTVSAAVASTTRAQRRQRLCAIRRATSGDIASETITAQRTQPLAHAATASAALTDSGAGHVGQLRDALALLICEGQDDVLASLPPAAHCVAEVSFDETEMPVSLVKRLHTVSRHPGKPCKRVIINVVRSVMMMHIVLFWPAAPDHGARVPTGMTHQVILPATVLKDQTASTMSTALKAARVGT